MSRTNPDEPPSVQEELERKTVELLETLVHRSETHRLEKSHLSMIAKALWNVTSGLVSNEISTLCSATADMNPAVQRMTRHFVGKGKVLSIIWRPEGDGYVVLTLDATTCEKSMRSVKSEVGLRENELDKLFAVLAKSGYTAL